MESCAANGDHFLSRVTNPKLHETLGNTAEKPQDLHSSHVVATPWTIDTRFKDMIRCLEF